MKFKSIFVLLNLTLLFFLAILVFLPLLVTNQTAADFSWQGNWPFILVLALVLAAFNVFYCINRRLFFLLEREDWPALVRYLEDRVIQRGNYSGRLVRLLANSYLVLSDSAAVMSLENKTAISRPALVDANILIFGAARILGRDISGAVRFFAVRKESAKGQQGEWVRWYHGFALLLDRQFETAAVEFSLLARLTKDGIIAGLSSYFLGGAISRALPEKREELQELSFEGSARVLKALPRLKDWNREASRLSAEIHVAILAKYMKETSRWLYPSAWREENA